MVVLTDEQWAVLEPLVEACRPHAKVPPSDLRRTVEAIIWRCTNGAKWRAIPAELGPWWKAAQIFIRWARLGVWDRLLDLAQERGVELGLAFLDGTSIRAHAKAAGASKKGDLEGHAMLVRRLADLVEAMAPKPSWWPTGPGAPSPSRWHRVRPTNSRSRPTSSRGSRDAPCGSWPTGATPPAPSATTFGRAARARRSRRSATRSPSPARLGPTSTATGSSASGAG
jgi:transposase